MEGHTKRDQTNLFDNIMQRIVIPISICYMIWILGVKIASNNTEANAQNTPTSVEILEA